MLRRDGERLPRGEIRVQPEIHGDVVIEPHGSGLLARLNVGPCFGCGTAPIALYDARLTRMRGDSFIVVGDEDCGKSWEHRTQRQAWWCRLDRADDPYGSTTTPGTTSRASQAASLT